MKKTIIGSLLLMVLLTVAPAGAATTCICVGMSSLIGNGCGNGAGGRTWQIHTDIDNVLFIGFLKTAAVQAEFKNTGKAFDTKTGWFCFK
jgi:hypothetical protein